MLKVLIGVLIGGALGAAMGATRSCETGACPLTATPYRGALYGAFMGFLVTAAMTLSGAPNEGAATLNEESTMTTSSAVAEVTTRQQFENEVLDAKVPVLVDLWAPWCGPCRAQSPIIDQVAEQAGDRARVVKVNVDEAIDLAGALGVQSIPTLIVFENGQEQTRLVGIQSAEVLAGALGI